MTSPERSALRRLCRLHDIVDGAGLSIEPDALGGPAVLLFRRGSALLAYRDACPHMGTSLTWSGRVLFDKGRRLRCANHNALFRVEDGRCIAGPCDGELLQRETVRVVGGYVWLDLGNHRPPGI
jgi:nitrite reductase/ring-hydroxylating ferredoxin subunit